MGRGGKRGGYNIQPANVWHNIFYWSANNYMKRKNSLLKTWMKAELYILVCIYTTYLYEACSPILCIYVQNYVDIWWITLGLRHTISCNWKWTKTNSSQGKIHKFKSVKKEAKTIRIVNLQEQNADVTTLLLPVSYTHLTLPTTPYV